MPYVRNSNKSSEVIQNTPTNLEGPVCIYHKKVRVETLLR